MTLVHRDVHRDQAGLFTLKNVKVQVFGLQLANRELVDGLDTITRVEEIQVLLTLIFQLGGDCGVLADALLDLFSDEGLGRELDSCELANTLPYGLN